MKRLGHEISTDWVTSTFPRIRSAMGGSELRRQIEAYNDLVARGADATSAAGMEFRMKRAGVNPHMAILNMLSCLQAPNDPFTSRWTARLFVLERNLTRLEAKGIPPSAYKSMLLDTGALDRLIAETNVLWTCLRLGGTAEAHALTSPGTKSATNYDVAWRPRWPLCPVAGDVKWFQTWVLKEEGADLLGTLNDLVLPDLRHFVHVSAHDLTYTDSMAADAALEVNALYKAAVNAETLHDDIEVYVEGEERFAQRPRAPRPKSNVKAGIDSISFRESDTGGGLMLTKTGSAPPDQDAPSVRRNLLSAASQIPRADRSTLTVAFVGSANHQDVDDVRECLFGRNDDPGLFDPETEETSLAHIDAVVFFAKTYESGKGPLRAREINFAHALVRRSPRLPCRKRLTLGLIKALLAAHVSVDIAQP